MDGLLEVIDDAAEGAALPAAEPILLPLELILPLNEGQWDASLLYTRGIVNT